MKLGSEGTWTPAELGRVRALAAALRGSTPARLLAARAPGRVNLIGEHTDYSNLPVLPAAVDRSTIVVAAARPDGVVSAANTNSAFTARAFELRDEIAPFETGDWGNYLKAAAQGLVSHARALGRRTNLKGIDLIVDGQVPVAAGLSSSAALTVALILAMAEFNEIEMGQLELAQLAARSERYVGTIAGGMDQAASVLGRRDHALFIEFDPLRASPVRIAGDAVLVIADSLERADKSGKLQAEYNRRVVECAVAARLIGKGLGLSNIRVLGDVVRLNPTRSSDEFIAMLNDCCNTTVDGLEGAAHLLGVSQSGLQADLFGGVANRDAIEAPGRLKLRERARHVFSEMVRVHGAVAALRQADLETMGALMNESHLSLALDFEVSTERLDRMVARARAAGALGARLIGAGFGGSILALCRPAEVAEVIEALDRDFYAGIGVFDPSAARGVFRASSGASLIELADGSALETV